MQERRDEDGPSQASSREQLNQTHEGTDMRKQAVELCKRYRLLFERARDIILFLYPDGRIIEANPAAVTAYNYSYKELTGMKISDLRSPETLPELKAQLEEANTVGNLFETIHRRKDGSTFPVEVNSTGITTDGERLIMSIIRDITARKQAEQALMESELRFRKMLEEVALVAVTVDIEGKVTFVNEFLMNLTGYEKEEILGKPFIKFVSPEQREQLQRIFAESIARGEVVPRYEADIETSWGETRTILFANVLLRDLYRNIIGTANIGQDITEQKQAAEEIRQSRKQVLDILESITDGFFALDNDWRYTYVNQRATQLVGKKKEEILFRNMWEVLPQLVGTRFYTEYHRAKEQMIPVSFEEFFQPLNKWFEVHAYPYENGLSVYVTDISRRKRAEQALRESEERYRLLIELSPDPVVVHSEGKIVYVNPATVKMLKAKSHEELIGKPVLGFVHPDFVEIVKDRIKQMKTGKSVGYIEEKFIRLDGQVVDVETAATPVIYEGKPAIMVVGRDITERKKIAREARQGRRLSEALNTINNIVNSTLDSEEIMNRALPESAKAIGAERAVILLCEGELWVVRSVYGYPQELVGTRALADISINKLATEVKAPIAINDAYNDPRVDCATMERYNIRSLLAVPFLARGVVVGIVDFSHHSFPIGFADIEVDFAMKFGASLSLALENARLFKALRECKRSL